MIQEDQLVEEIRELTEKIKEAENKQQPTIDLYDRLEKLLDEYTALRRKNKTCLFHVLP